MTTGGRPRTGGLFQRKGQWYARFSAAKDGETIRVVRALGTDSKQVAKAKLARLLNEELPPEQAARGETFKEAAQRIVERDKTASMKSWKDREQRLKQHIFPVIGWMSVVDIRARHVNELLEGVKLSDRRKGPETTPTRGTLKQILNCISVVLDDLWRKEVLPENVAKRVRLPNRDTATKERAVLTDFELARYLAWQHPQEDHRKAVLERQTMSCVSRLLGGVRTGDLHAMTWDSLDATNGRFGYGYAPRAKTKSPQRLIIDEMLRPFLRRWWEASGCPREGLLFPSLHDGRLSKAGAGEKHQVSHAGAFRRDLRRAFGVDALKAKDVKRKDGQALIVHRWVKVRELTPRESELFDGNAHTLPVDFHSWRRAYCQSLADAGVNAQLAKALAGHATESAHEKYLRNSDTARALPEAARPQIDLSKVIKAR